MRLTDADGRPVCYVCGELGWLRARWGGRVLCRHHADVVLGGLVVLGLLVALAGMVVALGWLL